MIERAGGLTIGSHVNEDITLGRAGTSNGIGAADWARSRRAVTAILELRNVRAGVPSRVCTVVKSGH